MKKMMNNELFNKIQKFEKKYADILIEWLKLIKNQQINHAWRPNNIDDHHKMKLYEISNQHDRALSNFEKNTDKNILLTYLKYSNKDQQRIYPWSFNYQEPNIDLVLNPIE